MQEQSKTPNMGIQRQSLSEIPKENPDLIYMHEVSFFKATCITDNKTKKKKQSLTLS
jgi:hypothetical protein